MTINHHAEPTGNVSAETPAGASPRSRAVVLFGHGGYCETSLPPYDNERALRHAVETNRRRLIDEGVLTLLAGRLCAVEPGFTEALIQIGRERLGHRGAQVQAKIDAAYAGVLRDKPAQGH